MDISLERKLLLGAQQFDPQALTAIFTQFNNGIYVYSMRLLGDYDLAQECTAETFSRFLRAVHNGHGPRDHLQAYLYQIAHNWITDHYRRNPPQIANLDECLPSNDQPIPNNIEAAMRQTRIRNALSQLKAEQRQVIVLRFLEGWSNEEVSAAICKPVGTVKTIQYRAIIQLRKILSAEERDE